MALDPGADRWSNDDSREKRAIGELWVEKGGENCLFIMPKGTYIKKMCISATMSPGIEVSV